MCDLKSFSFSHHFGSGFKYFSAVIICKLSKILNLRLSGGSSYTNIHTYTRFLEKGLRERICRKVSESLVYLCIFVHFSLELVSRFKSGKGGGMVAVKHIPPTSEVTLYTYRSKKSNAAQADLVARYYSL